MAVQVLVRNSWSDQLESFMVGETLHFQGLSWAEYLEISSDIGKRRFLTSFCEGEMEILWPDSQLTRWIGIMDRLICNLSDELRTQRKSIGMSTLRRPDLGLAMEPCRAFYFENESRVRGLLNLDMCIHPPPDLALKIMLSRRVTKRMQVYAGIGVREIWRFDGKRLIVFQLDHSGVYTYSEHSRYFPHFPIDEFVRFGNMSPELDDMTLARAFRSWVREQIALGWPNWPPEKTS